MREKWNNKTGEWEDEGFLLESVLMWVTIFTMIILTAILVIPVGLCKFTALLGKR